MDPTGVQLATKPQLCTAKHPLISGEVQILLTLDPITPVSGPGN